MTCRHQPETFYRDLLIIVGVILVVLFLREIFGWFFKTHDTRENTQEILEILRRIEKR